MVILYFKKKLPRLGSIQTNPKSKGKQLVVPSGSVSEGRNPYNLLLVTFQLVKVHSECVVHTNIPCEIHPDVWNRKICMCDSNKID